MTPRGTIVVGGSVAQRPGRGGHTWVFLQYLLGFRDLGWEVLLLDRLEPDMCVDSAGRPCAPEDSVNLAYLDSVMRSFELSDAYAVLFDGGSRCIGSTRESLTALIRESALFLNVNGFITDAAVLEAATLRAYLDIDPGFGQMWKELGLHDMLAGHDAYVTVGENVGQPDCAIPTCGLEWITTAQPVVLDHWPRRPAGGSHFTSVASWRGPFAPVEYRGETYGLRVHEWRRFAALPSLTGETFQIALDIDPVEAGDLALLRDNGWQLVDPQAVAGDPCSYRSYIQGSMAELMVAKNMYVRSWSGWFSDRSICYLASGRPVLAQDTGFTRLYPTGEGLLAFSSLDDACTGAEQIAKSYARHADRARSLAEEHFDSRKVLSRLLETLGVA